MVKGRLTYDFSKYDNGELLADWLRDMARDGSLSVVIAELWNSGKAAEYYEGKRKRSYVAARRLYNAKKRDSARVNLTTP